MRSSCTVSGLFSLTQCTRGERLFFNTPGNDQTTDVNGSHFDFYNTTITSADGHTTTTMVRTRSKSTRLVKPFNFVAILTGTFFVDFNTQIAFVDAINVIELYSGCYVPTDRSIFHTSVRAFGTVCGEAFELDDETISFPVKLSINILNDLKSFRLM